MNVGGRNIKNSGMCWFNQMYPTGGGGGGVVLFKHLHLNLNIHKSYTHSFVYTLNKLHFLVENSFFLTLLHFQLVIKTYHIDSFEKGKRGMLVFTV